MSLTISLPPDVEKRISEEAARTGLDASSLALKILLRDPNGTAMGEREAELVAQIHRLSVPKSPAEQRRYRALKQKNQSGTISEEERIRLFEIIDADEWRTVERLKFLVELAKLREQELPEVIDSLGLTPPGVR